MLQIDATAGSLRLVEHAEAAADHGLRCPRTQYEKPIRGPNWVRVGIGDRVGETGLTAGLNVLPEELVGSRSRELRREIDTGP